MIMPLIDVDSARTVSSFTVLHYARDFKTQITPNETQKITLVVAGSYVVAIAILWHVPVLKTIIYPFKLLTVGLHEMSHALMGLLTCAHIQSIEIDPDEGGSTRMTGGIPWLTLPAGYLGSSLIGAGLIACGFDTNASKIASIVLAVCFLVTLYWVRRDWISFFLIFAMSILFLVFWCVVGGTTLRFFVLFIGVMSCLYCLWDVIDDTIARKVNTSDAAAFAKTYGCFPSRVWGVIWLIQGLMFFGGGVILGLVVFKKSAEQQKFDSQHFLPIPSGN